MIQLILKRAPIGPNPEDYDVLADGAVVGRIFLSAAAPADQQWMWASGPRLRGDARGGDGSLRQELAARDRIVSASAGNLTV